MLDLGDVATHPLVLVLERLVDVLFGLAEQVRLVRELELVSAVWVGSLIRIEPKVHIFGNADFVFTREVRMGDDVDMLNLTSRTAYVCANG